MIHVFPAVFFWGGNTFRIQIFPQCNRALLNPPQKAISHHYKFDRISRLINNSLMLMAPSGQKTHSEIQFPAATCSISNISTASKGTTCFFPKARDGPFRSGLFSIRMRSNLMGETSNMGNKLPYERIQQKRRQ